MPLQVHNPESQPDDEQEEELAGEVADMLAPTKESSTSRQRRPRTVAYEPYRKGVKTGGRTIQLGSVGDDVRRLQLLLNRRRQTREALVEDGLFGLSTEAEVKKTQKSFKVKADGVVGRQTWAALGW